MLYKNCASFVDLFVICVCLCHTDMSVSCSLVVTYWERADLFGLLYVMFSLYYCHFPTWCAVSVVVLDCIDLCLLPYFVTYLKVCDN